MEFHIFTLSNGLRVIHKQVDGSPVSHAGLIIDAGSRDEIPSEHGLAHFIEHTIFKGTSKRRAFHILSRLDAVGGELNAYTTKEETCLYASFLSEHYERAIDLLGDIAFHSTFPEKEINKEKDVIIDEINSYLDTPGEQIFDDFEQQLFSGHSIGRGILGTAKHLRSFSKKDILKFIASNYHPSNMVFASVGDIPLKKLKRLCEKHVGETVPNKLNGKRVPYSEYQPKQEEIEREGFQAHGIIGNTAYSVPDEKRRTMVLLNNLLGGPGMNSRLNLNIREKYGITYHIDSYYTPYTDTGAFTVYLGTDKKHVKRVTKLVHKELKQLRDKKLGTAQLHGAKTQLLGQIALSQENRSSLMISIGRSLMLFGKVDSMEEIRKKIESITASQLLDAANEVFAPDQLSSLTYMPTK